MSPARRRSFVPLMLLMLVGAFAELFSLGALVVFLSMIAEPAALSRFALLNWLFTVLGASTQTEVIYLSTFIFAVAALGAAAIRVILQKESMTFVYGVSYEISSRLFRYTLAQDYIYHTRRNSSEILAAVNKAQQVTGELLVPLMQAVVSVVLAAFIIAGLMWIDPVVAVASGGGLAAIYLITSRVCHARLRRNSLIAAKAQGHRVRVMQEGLGGIRDILLDRSQPVFTEDYERAEAELRDARVSTALAAQSPRYIVEGLGMVVVAVVACVTSVNSGGIAAVLPTLGALALGAQRLLPLLQQIYGAWASSTGNRQLLLDLVDLLRQGAPPALATDAKLSFNEGVEIEHVGYRYAKDGRSALVDINLSIPRGARIGIAGKTGSGKSTLMDIIIGLLEPSEGEIRVDGVPLTAANRYAWQRYIAHVPQAIFLSDASIAENIAFGVRYADIDLERVKHAAEQAELTDVIAALPQGYQTKVGERGVQLSGGQRQRIGIARALYKQASVLVFDEATSALDNETEAAVMSAIERLDRTLTLIVIAHRLSTLEGCDMIVRLENGRALVQEKVGP
ncbi:ABC transporter ATP-binding protein [Ancylobacter dichloromethanicus]|nr:ABC transporter ATP-binding protein [Ancylobacter dichloromethanicus]